MIFPHYRERVSCLINQFDLKTMKRFTLLDSGSVMTRRDMARILSEFTLLIDRVPDSDKTCSFADDTSRVARQMCQLNLMGVDPRYQSLSNFRPYEVLTKSQFLTILARLVYGESYDTTASAAKQKAWYKKQINLLYKAHIIPSRSERGLATNDFVVHAFLKVLQIDKSK